MVREFKEDILGTEYTIKVSDDRKEIGLSDENWGECHVYEKTILVCSKNEEGISDDANRTQVAEILAHEVFHAYLNESGNTYALEPEVEELMCAMFSKVWRKMFNTILDSLDSMGMV